MKIYIEDLPLCKVKWICLFRKIGNWDKKEGLQSVGRVLQIAFQLQEVQKLFKVVFFKTILRSLHLFHWNYQESTTKDFLKVHFLIEEPLLLQETNSFRLPQQHKDSQHNHLPIGKGSHIQLWEIQALVRVWQTNHCNILHNLQIYTLHQ